MTPFRYERPSGIAAACASAAEPAVKFIAGGTNLVDLMKLGIETPAQLVDISLLPLAGIDETPEGGLRIGARVTNSALAADMRVRRRYPLLSQAILAGASTQLRNKATTGGNLLQRTRCAYFYDTTKPCNKRVPGSGCAAIGGANRWHAVLGTSDNCIAAHASDLAVALVALDAAIELCSSGRNRTVPLADLYRLPDATPHIETVLEPGEVISAITVSSNRAARRSHYLKVRDRASFEFAVVSAAVALETDGARIRQARVALGGVGTKPWRLPRVEAALAGANLEPATLRAAAAFAAESAQGRGANDFKIELMQRAIVRALENAGARA
jgi:xanthine dehydrogenase YagS FAD-binding subunit